MESPYGLIWFARSSCRVRGSKVGVKFEIPHKRSTRVDVRRIFWVDAIDSNEANELQGEGWFRNGPLFVGSVCRLGKKKGRVRVAREDDCEVTEGREDVREVFQQRGSGAKRKLSRCRRNQMGNEPILALPEGA
ncbi:hypothetical protein Tco_0435548, partial [Tanacetum coccineum]